MTTSTIESSERARTDCTPALTDAPPEEPAVGSSNELAGEVSYLANVEKLERDRLREEALARERERAKYD